jgi:phosphoribosylformimino-5-aminoimidazole carboxamide ribotide isomerase
MILYPAMDLMDGLVVRLRQGRFDDATDYRTDPAEALARFAAAGATWAHVVDLAGAA